MAQSVNNNISGNPFSVVQESWIKGNSPRFVANIPSNDIYMTQRYVFEPTTPNSGLEFQIAIDNIVETFSSIIKSIRNNNPNMLFYAIIQTQESAYYNLRHPTEKEILLSVNLALAYGAKGIIYYLYAPTSYETGLLDSNRNPTETYNHVGYINSRYLTRYGKIFMALVWKDGFSIHKNTQEPINTNKNLYDVKCKLPGGSYDPESETYVEIGYFTASDSQDYYMIVNRRATENRRIEITFQVDPYSDNKVKDLFTNIETSFSKDEVGSNGQFTYIATIDSGAAKLLRLDKAPHAPKNLRIVNANQDGQNVMLAWDPNKEHDFLHYAIYRGYREDKFSPVNWSSIPVATTVAATWTDPIVKINSSAPSSVHYRVTAVDSANNESNYSNSVSTKSYQIPKKATLKTNIQPLPEAIALHQNYPNPFNSMTEIRFDLSETGWVIIKIYSVLGEEVRTLVDKRMEIGFHSVIWDGKDEIGNDLPSGIYIYRFQVISRNTASNSFEAAKKLALLR